VDCIESCPAAPKFPPLPTPWLLFNYDGMWVVMGAIFGLGTILIVFLAILAARQPEKTPAQRRKESKLKLSTSLATNRQ